MVDGGISISAAIAIGSKFFQRSRFSSRHRDDAVYDQEADKSLKSAERFENITKEDLDYFEAEEYSRLRAQ